MSSVTSPAATAAPAPVPGASELREKMDLLKGFVDASIADIGKKRKVNQRRATVTKVLILCMSGGATILLGLNLGPAAEPSIKNIAFALTSLVTLLNALEPFFNHRALWVEHERANAAFFQLKDRLVFYACGRPDAELHASDLRDFYDQYEQAWAALNQAWNAQRQKYQDQQVPGKR